MNGLQDRIFISFSSADRKIADALCDDLEKRGFACWISSRDVGGGENYQEAIVQAIRSVKVMLLVFTGNANESHEITKELALASRWKTVVIPLRMENVEPNAALDYELSTRQWIDAFEDKQRALQTLTGRIKTILSDVPAAPARHAAAMGEGKKSAPPNRFPKISKAWAVIAGMLVVAAGAYLSVGQYTVQRNGVLQRQAVAEVTMQRQSLAEARRKYDDQQKAVAALQDNLDAARRNYDRAANLRRSPPNLQELKERIGLLEKNLASEMLELEEAQKVVGNRQRLLTDAESRLQIVQQNIGTVPDIAKVSRSLRVASFAADRDVLIRKAYPAGGQMAVFLMSLESKEAFLNYLKTNSGAASDLAQAVP